MHGTYKPHYQRIMQHDVHTSHDKTSSVLPVEREPLTLWAVDINYQEKSSHLISECSLHWSCFFCYCEGHTIPYIKLELNACRFTKAKHDYFSSLAIGALGGCITVRLPWGLLVFHALSQRRLIQSWCWQAPLEKKWHWHTVSESPGADDKAPRRCAV